MIVYEVYIKVQTRVIQKFETYMADKHIPDMIETECFLKAEFETLSKGNYRVSYQATDRAILDQYLRNDAERLRVDFVKNLPEGIEISRKVFEK